MVAPHILVHQACSVRFPCKCARGLFGLAVCAARPRRPLLRWVSAVGPLQLGVSAVWPAFRKCSPSSIEKRVVTEATREGFRASFFEKGTLEFDTDTMAQTTPECLFIPAARMSDAPTIMRRTLKADITYALAAYGKTDALPQTKDDRFNLLRDTMIEEGDHVVAGFAPATMPLAPTPLPGLPAAAHTLAAAATAPAGPGGPAQHDSVARLVHVVESLLASRQVPGLV